MVSAIIFSFAFVLLSLIINVNCQTCENISQYSGCSSNSECGCLIFSLSENVGICGVVSMSCSQFVPCQSPNDACEQSDHVCVHHPRCDSRPLCYPLSMTGDRECPSIKVSNYSSALTTDDGRYTRPGSGTSGHYYEAIEIIVDRTGTYDITSISGMDTHGFLYNGTFYPLNPSASLVNRNDDDGPDNNFKLTAFLEAGVPYTLVVSTHSAGAVGPFSIVATGPGDMQFIPINAIDTTTTSTSTRPSIIISNYSNVLTTSSGTFARDGGSGTMYYYHAIEVRVNTTGTYTFKSSSTVDTYGYLYQGNFYPSYPAYNIVSRDDDTAGNSQFQLTASLRSDITYILVFTTYSERATTAFSIIASGPDDVIFNQI